MRRATKYIVSGSLFIIGLILIIIGAVTLKNYRSNHYGPLSNFTQTIDNTEFSNISITSEIGKLVVKKGTKAEIIAKNVHEKYFSWEVSDDKLTIKYNPNDFINANTLGISFQSAYNLNLDPKITIILPEKEYNNFTAKNHIGSISIDGITADNFITESDIGQVKIIDCKGNQSSSITNGLGEITLRNSNFNNLDLENDIGSINLNDCLVLGKTSASTGIGEIDFNLSGDLSNYDIDLESGIGSSKINGKKGSSHSASAVHEMDIECDIGSIKVNFDN